MNYDLEYCRPFENKKNIWMKLEHVGRYLFAQDFFKNKKVKTIADIACGDGYGSNYLSKTAKNVFAVDKNFSYFNKKYLSNKKINFLKMDLNIDDEYDKIGNLDAIVCFETLEHLKYPDVFLSKLYRKLNKNGDVFHLHVFEKTDLEKQFLKLGFKIKEILGQSLVMKMCLTDSKLIKDNILTQNMIDKCFNYDENSIKALARFFAIPNDNDIDKSYSYIYVLQK